MSAAKFLYFLEMTVTSCPADLYAFASSECTFSTAPPKTGGTGKKGPRIMVILILNWS